MAKKKKVSLPSKFTANAIVGHVAETCEISKKQMKEIYETLFGVMEKGVLAGERVPCGEFGKLLVRVRPARKARKGRNPLTGEEIMIKAKPASTVPKFSFGKAFKEKALKAKKNKSPVGMEITLVRPRGFCAGVERAIFIVEKALENYSPPIYVRHEIVHNKAVVSRLRAKGAVFIEQLEEVPAGSTVIFSAHGVPRRIFSQADELGLKVIDATCPLVKKVHNFVERHSREQREIILIGHTGHPEVIGTMGQLPPGKVRLVGTREEAAKLAVSDENNLAYVTQTTLSVMQASGIIAALKKRFPSITGPAAGDLCYATTNRQQAVIHLAKRVSLVLIVGSANSSNSNRMRETASSCGVRAYLVDTVADVRPEWFTGIDRVGISSGASAPEDLVQEIVTHLLTTYPGSSVSEWVVKTESVKFSLPPELA